MQVHHLITWNNNTGNLQQARIIKECIFQVFNVQEWIDGPSWLPCFCYPLLALTGLQNHQHCEGWYCESSVVRHLRRGCPKEGRWCSVQQDGACSKPGIAKAQLQLTLLCPLHLWSPASGGWELVQTTPLCSAGVPQREQESAVKTGAKLV